MGPRLSHPVTREDVPIPIFPIGKRIVVQRIPEETEIGGLIIPEKHRDTQLYGTVIAAGPKAQEILDDCAISIGDTICFGKYVGVNWEWQPPGTTSIKDRCRVDLVSIDDIYGCKELAEKMIDGRLGIKRYEPEDGDSEYRFFEQVGTKEEAA